MSLQVKIPISKGREDMLNVTDSTVGGVWKHFSLYGCVLRYLVNKLPVASKMAWVFQFVPLVSPSHRLTARVMLMSLARQASCR